MAVPPGGFNLTEDSKIASMHDLEGSESQIARYWDKKTLEPVEFYLINSMSVRLEAADLDLPSKAIKWKIISFDKDYTKL